jgi:mRNA deadenylase 3'-5' endonuclease subunit Ccr4
MLSRLSPLKGRGTAEMNLVTYNVLSSSLASPSYFVECDPKHLDSETRYEKLLEQLLAEMKSGSVICLQEVSQLWAGRLHSFFLKHNYYFVSSHYTKGWQGYMGCGVAFPMETYTAEDVEVVRVSDTKPWPRAAKQTPSLLSKVSGTVLSALVWPFGSGWLSGGKKKEDNHWDLARARVNTMVMLRLSPKNPKLSGQQSVCVGTYHMPCMFWAPKVMVIHTALAMQKLQRFAQDDHAILAGDFNFKPEDSAYKLITTGTLDRGDRYYPEPLHEEEQWTPALEVGFDSAYQTMNGQEPDFTNYAKIQDKPMFIETLDYIFYSPSLKVLAVKELPHRDQVAGPLPNQQEPSDHIMLAAKFAL